MNEVTLLSDEQIFGYNKLDIFNKILREAKMTDFSILLGGHECIGFGDYWIKPNFCDNVINEGGSGLYNYTNCRKNGIRPVMSYSKIKNDISKERINRNEIVEIEYGEYPQYAVDNILQEKLEELYQNCELYETGKKYTTDSRKYNEYDKDFLLQEHIEYEFDDKKYVRVKANSYYDGLLFGLSNDGDYRDGDYVWVEVSKVKWLIDEENDIALSKGILVAGIQFDNKKKYSGITKLSGTYGTYEEAMALIEEAKRRHNEILDKSIIGKSILDKDKSYIKIKK